MQGMIYFIQNFSKNDSLLKMTNLAPCMGFVAVGFNQDLYGGLSESRQICKNNWNFEQIVSKINARTRET